MGIAWRAVRVASCARRSLKKGSGQDEQRVGPLACKCCEGRVDLAAGAGVEDLDLQPHRAPRGYRFPYQGLRARRIGWIDEDGDATHCGHQLAQEFQPLRHHLAEEKIDAGDVASRPGRLATSPS